MKNCRTILGQDFVDDEALKIVADDPGYLRRAAGCLRREKHFTG